MSDGALVAEAPAVAVVRFLDAGPGSGQLPSTLYLAEVEDVLSGHLAGGTIEVRVPGGTSADGLHGWQVYGAPRFATGERALLFLEPRADGSYGVLHLMLGAFRLVDRQGESLVVRDLSAAHAVSAGGVAAQTAGVETARRFAEFARWIEDRAAGVERPADYRTDLPAEEVARTGAKYALLNDGGQCSGARLPIRWFLFDDGGQVSWRMNASGQPGMSGSPRGVDELRAALAAWTDHPASNVRLVYGGTTTATVPSGDNTGVISFDDPTNEISGSFNGSGTLAVGGPYFSCQASNFGGESYRRATRGFIITQDGAGSFFGGHGGQDGAEVFAHEVGHTLGLGHSGVSGALMRSFAYADGRGARLGGDDRNALGDLYGDGAAGGGTLPAAPSHLAASRLSNTQIRLTWRDNSDDETVFRVELLDGSAYREIGSLGPGSTAGTVSNLQPATTYSFRVRACNAAGCSAYSNTATASTGSPAPPPPGPASCRPAEELCLQDGRFAVAVTWRDQRSGATGVGTPLAGSRQSGYFWFFRPDNVELVVKVLDGRAINGAFWVFYGALSDVEYEVSVRDTVSGDVQTYRNPPGEICGHGDTAAFAVAGATASGLLAPSPGPTLAPAAAGGPAVQAGSGPPLTLDLAAPGAEPPLVAGAPQLAVSGSCAPAANRLCLQNGRFEVTVSWINQRAEGASGTGRVTTNEVGGDRTGFFWFFNSSNVELVVKMIDGRSVNGRWWFFYGALSDVEYDVVVHDTVSGQRRAYHNSPGNLCGRGDTSAF